MTGTTWVLRIADPFEVRISAKFVIIMIRRQVSDSSAIADELNNKLVQGTVIKDKLDQRVKNKKLYLGKTHREYFQDTSLVNQVDQIKADLTQYQVLLSHFAPQPNQI
ncbi:hypothetical protein OK016_25775 [Vibrio chagasii]|nr:hypothetical protein [Vibrio chagasii]